MSRGAIIALSILGFIILLGLAIVGWGFGVYNKLVAYDQNVKQSWGQVENQYQRRYDLIPNLVATVKGYAKHEADVFEKVAEARSSVGKLTITPQVPGQPPGFQEIPAGSGWSEQRTLKTSDGDRELSGPQSESEFPVVAGTA